MSENKRYIISGLIFETGGLGQELLPESVFNVIISSENGNFTKNYGQYYCHTEISSPLSVFDFVLTRDGELSFRIQPKLMGMEFRLNLLANNCKSNVFPVYEGVCKSRKQQNFVRAFLIPVGSGFLSYTPTAETCR